MKYIALVSRYLLGFIFFVFGLNGFLHFIPMPPPAGLSGQFMGALAVSHYLFVVMAVELLGGVLLLAGRYVPLTLLVLAPVIFNILCFHVFMAPSGIPLAIFVCMLWLGSAWGVRHDLAPVLRPVSTERKAA